MLVNPGDVSLALIGVWSSKAQVLCWIGPFTADACGGCFNSDVKECSLYLLGLIKYYLWYKESGVVFVHKLQ